MSIIIYCRQQTRFHGSFDADARQISAIDFLPAKA
jgi:hypothetical protein